MSDQWWSYVLTIIGVLGFWLAGKKVWWAWYVNIANQVLWFTYAVVTDQWGFIFGALFYTVVFVKNAYMWTRDHHEDKYEHVHKPNIVGRILEVNQTKKGVEATFVVDDPETLDRIRNGKSWKGEFSGPADRYLSDEDIEKRDNFDEEGTCKHCGDPIRRWGDIWGHMPEGVMWCTSETYVKGAGTMAEPKDFCTLPGCYGQHEDCKFREASE